MLMPSIFGENLFDDFFTGFPSVPTIHFPVGSTNFTGLSAQ